MKTKLWTRCLSIVLTLLVGISVRSSVLADSPGVQDPTQKPGQESLDDRLLRQLNQEIRPLLKTHCGECHMGESNEAGVNLEDYKEIEKIREHASTWEQIRGVIRAEAMPPPEESKLDRQARERLASWIQSALHEVDCDCEQPTPPVTLRRLNQVEYDNTVRDLLGIDFYPSKDIGFVSDDVGNGFDNQGEVLTLSPIMLEKYLQAASLIAKRTIETDREKLRTQRFELEPITFGNQRSVKVLLAQGEYEVYIRMRFGDRQEDKAFVVVRMDGQTMREWDVKTNTANFEFNVELDEGYHELTIEYESDEHPDKKLDSNRRLFFESIRFRGPTNGLPLYPEIHQKVVVAYPEEKDTLDSTEIGSAEAARRVFAKLLPRAYRRNVSKQEVEAIVAICERAKEAGFSYVETIQYGLQAALVSPHFLFLSEAAPSGKPLDSFGLASRLSYFLWSTMPDAELMELAQQDRLHDPSVLKQQVRRMLASPKSEALIKGFFSQWLGLRNLNKIDIDREKYLQWNDRLRASMIKEVEMFCSQLVTNGSVDDFTTATFTFVNPRMAEFYGLQFDGRDPAGMYPNQARERGGENRRSRSYEREDDWIRIELPENRKGILTQAAILALTSNPTRTSPVKRGKWILENMLGDPPPSAPPNVPTLEQAKHEPNASLRERLEIHRSNPSCAGCHKIMDPIGLGLENFDAIGRWREKEEGKEIVPSGELADGSKFSGPSELVEILSSRRDQILENLASRMMIYALGRGLQRVDRCSLDRVIRYTNQNDRSVQSLIEAIVMSDAFLQTPAYRPTQVEGVLSDAK